MLPPTDETTPYKQREPDGYDKSRSIVHIKIPQFNSFGPSLKKTQFFFFFFLVSFTPNYDQLKKLFYTKTEKVILGNCPREGISLLFSVSRHSKQIKIKITTVQQIKSGIWEVKGGTCTKTLAKNQVRGIFRIYEVSEEMFYPNLKRFVWRRHAGAHQDELQHGGRKPTETSVTEFC